MTGEVGTFTKEFEPLLTGDIKPGGFESWTGRWTDSSFGLR